jgi:hypothetical protein
MIDGKTFGANWWRAQTIFKNTRTALNKAVEIIANPSAKYDAAGSAGIFLISS